MTGQAVVRRRVRLAGIVQGVGFRPYVYGLARRHELGGWVENDAAGVRLEVQGPPDAVDAFVTELPLRPPPLAVIEEVEISSVPVEPAGETFRIVTSDRAGTATTLVAPDVAPCRACLAEMADRSDRRHRYPFTNCTGCGPRFSIITGLPYDRPNTTMAGFALCERCRDEYHDPGDRRFHAQPVCCPDCGPRLSMTVDAAAAALIGGQIVAVKGVGGYHLCAVADHEAAVATLRSRKHRQDKPFALLVVDVAAARELCEVDAAEEPLLTGPERPIVLLRRRADAPVAPSVAPGYRELGVMLAPSPLHQLLIEAVGAPIVCTSGNVSQEPIAYEDEDARARLAPIADAFLGHDRPIRIRVDDSVLRVIDGRPSPIRRSRGFAPRPVALPVVADRPVLAVGADLKNTITLARGRHAVVSQHVGDLDHPATVRAFEDTVAHLGRLLEVRPEVVAHDLHPQYRSTQYALDRADLRPVAVQHHHAHVAACLADNDRTGPVIGVAFDGLGYGDDGTFWGGEFLVADLVGYDRRASLAPVPMPGGDAATRQPWRMAAVHLDAIGAADRPPDHLSAVGARWDQVLQLARHPTLSPRTSSAGRLFDAVASLLDVRHEVTYEGQAAIELEQLADPAETAGHEPVVDRVGDRLLVRGDGFVAQVVEDLDRGVAAPAIAARFHHGLAAAVVEVCRRIGEDTGLTTVALSGGVFLNALLLTATIEGLGGAGFEVLRHHQVPCNDGGISLGQAAVAAARQADGAIAG